MHFTSFFRYFFFVSIECLIEDILFWVSMKIDYPQKQFGQIISIPIN